MDQKPHNPHEKQPGHFFNGLLVGLILGFALALLFTTKKGKRMVKALTEEGLDSISELRKRLDNIEFMLDEDDLDEEYSEEPKSLPAVKNGIKQEHVLEEKKSPDEPEKRGSKRRFFRGIARKN